MSVHGLAPWDPAPDSIELVEQVNEILTDYADYLPMTGRQIFYRMVATNGYGKTEKAYDLIAEQPF